MLIEIKRHWYTNRSTMGVLGINGTHTCFTLEDVARAKGVKIPKETCISAGSYNVIMDYSPRHEKIMPHILNVPLFEGVRFDIANKSVEVEGCIAVGFERFYDLLGSSSAAYEYITKQINETFIRNEPIELVITDEQL